MMQLLFLLKYQVFTTLYCFRARRARQKKDSIVVSYFFRCKGSRRNQFIFITTDIHILASRARNDTKKKLFSNQQRAQWVWIHFVHMCLEFLFDMCINSKDDNNRAYSPALSLCLALIQIKFFYQSVSENYLQYIFVIHNFI